MDVAEREVGHPVEPITGEFESVQCVCRDLRTHLHQPPRRLPAPAPAATPAQPPQTEILHAPQTVRHPLQASNARSSAFEIRPSSAHFMGENTECVTAARETSGRLTGLHP